MSLKTKKNCDFFSETISETFSETDTKTFSTPVAIRPKLEILRLGCQMLLRTLSKASPIIIMFCLTWGIKKESPSLIFTVNSCLSFFTCLMIMMTMNRLMMLSKTSAFLRLPWLGVAVAFPELSMSMSMSMSMSISGSGWIPRWGEVESSLLHN